MCVKFPSNVGGTSPLQPAAPKPANPAPEKTPAPVPNAPDINTKDNLKPTSPEFLKPPPFDPGEGNVHLCKYVPSEDGGLNVHKCVSRPGDGEGLQIYKCVAWTKVPDKLAEKLKEALEQQKPALPDDLKQKIKDLHDKYDIDNVIQKVLDHIIKGTFPDKPVGPAHLCVAEVPDPDNPIGPSHLCVAEVPDPENPIGPSHLCISPEPIDVPEIENIDIPDDIRELLEEILKNLPSPAEDDGFFNCAFYPERPELV